MKKLTLSFFLLSLSSLVQADPAQKLQGFILQNDSLGARVYIKSLAQKKMTWPEWVRMRRLLIIQAPQVGYDLLRSWDRAGAKAFSENFAHSQLAALAQADALQSSKRFSEALSMYQDIARQIKTDLGRSKGKGFFGDNERMYFYVLHAMGRCLYGMGHYIEAFETLTWIPIAYPKYRQVLFEKMWSAFRSGRMDLALGSIASQRSTFFSRWVDPEAYLIQIYVYKKLCRQKEMDAVMNEIRTYRAAVQDKKLSLSEGLSFDIEELTLWKIAQQDPAKAGAGESKSALELRKKEQQSLLSTLGKNHQRALVRLSDSLNNVLAYAKLSTGSGKHQLQAVEKLMDRSALFKMDLEIWPADSSEEWIDEVGAFRFVGESQCGKAVSSL